MQRDPQGRLGRVAHRDGARGSRLGRRLRRIQPGDQVQQRRDRRAGVGTRVLPVSAAMSACVKALRAAVVPGSLLVAMMRLVLVVTEISFVVRGVIAVRTPLEQPAGHDADG